MVRAYAAPQGIGVLTGRIDGQRAVFPLNGGGAAGVDRHAVHFGNQRARRNRVIRQHVAGGRFADTRHAVDMVLQDAQRVGRQGGDPGRGIQQEQVLPGRQVQRKLR